MRWSPRAHLLVLALLASAVAGCSSDSPPPPALCPDVGIINGLEDLEQPPNAPTGDLAYRAAMENLDGGCRAEGGDLVVEIALDLIVLSGPAMPGGIVELPYFVAISAPGGQLLDRQDFVARVTVPSGARRGGVTETFSQRFVGRAAGASDYQVLFGFALPESEALRQYRRG
jgi:hypothetical protein